MPSDDDEGGGFVINPAQIVARGVAEGLSASKIVGLLQDNGAGMRRQTVYRMVSEVRAAIANRPMVQGMPTDRLPTGDEYTKWTTARTGYSTQILMVTRDRETGLIGTSMTSYTTRDPHSIDVALQTKLGDFEEQFGEGGNYEDQQLLGAIPFNIFEMSPE